MTLFAELALVFLIFVLASTLKGMIGMGLPMIAIPLLTFFMTPAEAAAIIVLPALVANTWQAIAGPAFFTLLKRLWLMFAGVLIGFAIGALALNATESPWALPALGAVLITYALLGLFNIHFSVPPKWEIWLAPVIGIVNGIISVITAVFSVPALPYFDGLHLNRDELVQALGMLFAFSTIALAVTLARGGIMRASVALPSIAALAAMPIGLRLGQMIRVRIAHAHFRKIFLIALLVLGSDLVLRSLL